MDQNTVRAIIFFIAGLVVIFFPDRIYKFQIYVLNRLRIKNNLQKENTYYRQIGLIFFVIAFLLFIYSMVR